MNVMPTLPAPIAERVNAAPTASAKVHADTTSEKSHEQYAALSAEERPGVDRYLLAGIEAEAEQFMRTAAPDNRNEPLLKAACNIFELANSSPTFDIDEIEERLIAMGDASGHAPEKVRKTVSSARKRTTGKGRDVQAIAAKRAGTTPPAETPPAPPAPTFNELDGQVHRDGQSGPLTARTVSGMNWLKKHRPITHDAVNPKATHDQKLPGAKLDQVIADLRTAIQECGLTEGGELWVMGLLRDRTDLSLADLWLKVWAALHAPTPQDPTSHPEDDDREPVQSSRDSYEFLQNVVRALVACNERDPRHPRFILNLDGRPARLAKNVIEPLGRYSMNYELTTNLAPFRYEKNDETGEWSKKPDNMSSEVGELLLGMNTTDASKRFPIVELIANVPRLDPSTGEITRSGYDSNSRTFVILADDLLYEMPEGEITQQQLAGAIARIDELLHDFCFSSPADRANAFAMLLTGVLAGSWGDITTPLFAVDGAVQGSGKSLLCWIAAAMAGVVDQASTSGRQRGTEAELDKMLGFEMSKARAAIILDNITECLTSEELVRICTELRTSLRLNGGGTAIVRCNILKIVNGNCLSFIADLAKRIVRVYLDPLRPDPENRSNWKIGGVDELKAHVRKNLGKLIAALHVMVLAWIQAGRQEYEGVLTHGRFPDWSKVVGNVLAHAGIQGFLANKDAVAAADEETADARQILASVKAQVDRMQVTAFRAADVAKFLDAEVKQIVLGGKHPDALNLLLGRWLGKHVNTPVVIDSATWTLLAAGDHRSNTKLYQFERQQ